MLKPATSTSPTANGRSGYLLTNRFCKNRPGSDITKFFGGRYRRLPQALHRDEQQCKPISFHERSKTWWLKGEVPQAGKLVGFTSAVKGAVSSATLQIGAWKSAGIPIVNRLLYAICRVLALVRYIAPDVKNIRFSKPRKGVTAHRLDRRQFSFIA
jgi:hypothetical protein